MAHKHKSFGNPFCFCNGTQSLFSQRAQLEAELVACLCDSPPAELRVVAYIRRDEGRGGGRRPSLNGDWVGPRHCPSPSPWGSHQNAFPPPPLSCHFPSLARDGDALLASGAWRLAAGAASVFFPGADAVEALAVFERVLRA